VPPTWTRGLILSTVPAGLADALHKIYLWSGPESLLQINEPTAAFTPDVLPWANRHASDTYLDLTRTVEQYSDDNPGKGDYLARTTETAIRLATIRAAGRWGRGAHGRRGDIEWGAGIAWTSGQALTQPIKSSYQRPTAVIRSKGSSPVSAISQARRNSSQA